MGELIDIKQLRKVGFLGEIFGLDLTHWLDLARLDLGHWSFRAWPKEAKGGYSAFMRFILHLWEEEESLGAFCNISLLRALSEFILWGHLLASDPDYYIIGCWLWLWDIMDMIICCFVLLT